ncbi:hypothetical protein QGN23_09170 [Chryseobacterium gotjawalense]|uniref:Uncharacterized protein n=1 Tax=Chryseobacterium gotjawalense TaxID=3042315 RepID=A0ABY8RAS3_9FLAO|nr:hypothetical protein [Chryseobacterium sp. wdc7]WHF50609.1 hypothetical protein QGN23_09170 [Chryseobacterium sp. wdc7]
MRKNIPYFLMIAGAFLLVLNLWSADFDTDKINFWSAGASLMMIILGFIELKKKQKNEN